VLEEWLDELCFHADYRQETYRVSVVGGRWKVVSRDDHLTGPLEDILSSSDLIVYPRRLILPVWRVNWLWYVRTSRTPVRIGNAEQAERYVRGDVSAVQAIEWDDILGCSAFLDHNWSNVPTLARSFPQTCGV
jgi:hypothetical protein